MADSNTPGPSRPPIPPELAAIIKANTGQAPMSSVPIQPPKRTWDKPDEKCWIRCKQTNARRALEREAECTAFCYLNFRNQLSKLTPVPGVPNAYVGTDNATPTPTLTHPALEGKKQDELPSYRLNWLDGRYIYRARGRKMIARHMDEMGGEGKWIGIEKLRERCDENEKQNADFEVRRQKLMKAAMGMEVNNDNERLICLSTLYTTTLQRFHLHLLRIYTPVFNNLARLPETYRDGTQLKMLDRIWSTVSEGKAFDLAGRMYESTVNVSRQLKEMRDRKNGGGNGGAPPPFPPLGGLGGGPSEGGPGGPVAPPAARDGGASDGSGSSSNSTDA